jgi:hypothetical protein
VDGDESIYWLELLVKSGLLTEVIASELEQERRQILAMTISPIRTPRAARS